MAAHDRHDLPARRAVFIPVEILSQRPIDSLVVDPLRQRLDRPGGVPSARDKVIVDPPIQAATAGVAAAGKQFGGRVEGRTVRIVGEVAKSGEHQRAAGDELALVRAAEVAPQEYRAADVDLLPGDWRLLEIESAHHDVFQRCPAVGRLA